MTTIVLIGGFLFWTGAAYFGTRKTLEDSNAPIWSMLGPLAKLPGGLLGPATLGFVVGGYFLQGQIQAISAEAGPIGPHWMLAVVSGVIGSICLAGFSKRDALPRKRSS